MHYASCNNTNVTNDDVIGEFKEVVLIRLEQLLELGSMKVTLYAHACGRNPAPRLAFCPRLRL